MKNLYGHFWSIECVLSKKYKFLSQKNKYYWSQAFKRYSVNLTLSLFIILFLSNFNTKKQCKGNQWTA